MDGERLREVDIRADLSFQIDRRMTWRLNYVGDMMKV